MESEHYKRQNAEQILFYGNESSIVYVQLRYTDLKTEVSKQISCYAIRPIGS